VGVWVCHVVTSLGLGTDEVGDTAEMGASGDDEEAVVLSTLPVLRVSCDLRVDVLLLCGVAVACEKAKGDDPVDDMLPLGPGDEFILGLPISVVRWLSLPSTVRNSDSNRNFYRPARHICRPIRARTIPSQQVLVLIAAGVQQRHRHSYLEKSKHENRVHRG
jgi:hypothetical protein